MDGKRAAITPTVTEDWHDPITTNKCELTPPTTITTTATESKALDPATTPPVCVSHQIIPNKGDSTDPVPTNKPNFFSTFPSMSTPCRTVRSGRNASATPRMESLGSRNLATRTVNRERDKSRRKEIRNCKTAVNIKPSPDKCVNTVKSNMYRPSLKTFSTLLL